MTTTAETTLEEPAPPLRPASERFMRRLLRVSDTDRAQAASAHRALRTSIIVTGIRCLITYVALPLLAPVLSFAGMLATPLGITLGIVALISGTLSLRRFWVSDHRGKWMYTAFIAVVFVIVAVTLTVDLIRLGSGA